MTPKELREIEACQKCTTAIPAEDLRDGAFAVEFAEYCNECASFLIDANQKQTDKAVKDAVTVQQELVRRNLRYTRMALCQYADKSSPVKINKHAKAALDRFELHWTVDMQKMMKKITGHNKWPPLNPGTRVRTLEPKTDPRVWAKEALAERKWDVLGTITMHHDSHGLCYDVCHDDGTQGCYEPDEFEVL